MAVAYIGARVALGFFLQHREILLSLSGISDLKEAVELMSSTLAPATAAAITQFGLTAHIADSVVEEHATQRCCLNR